MNGLRRTKLSSQQSGMASFLVTMILMIVLSLIVLGFGQLSQRNASESLDNQLSTQAFYAAESAVNDVQQILEANPTTTEQKTSCGPSSPPSIWSSLPASGTSYEPINSTGNVAYTCVLVNPEPQTLSYTVTTDGSKAQVIPLISSTGFNTLTLSWTPSSGAGNSSACPATNSLTGLNGSNPDGFSDASDWLSSSCGYGILRFDLVDYDGVNSLSGLVANTMTTFAVPTSNGNSTDSEISFDPGGSDANNVVPAYCTNSECQVTISSGLSAGPYYMRAGSVYESTPLTISGTDGNGNPVDFQQAEVLVDATGKANYVLRRIQVALPTEGLPQNEELSPPDAIQTEGSICKEFQVWPPADSSDSGYQDSSGESTCTMP